MKENQIIKLNKVDTVGLHLYPKQSKDVGKDVNVCFRKDLSNQLSGILVRDDMESPYVTIIRLNDGRYVLSDECQYSK